MNRSFISFSLLAASACAFAQTSPIQPQTPDVVVPPKITLPPDGTTSNPLKVDEAVRMALRLQPTVDIAQAGIRAAQGRTEQARSGLRPTFSATASGGRTEVIQGGNGSGAGGGNNASGFTTQGGISINQLIFDFNRTRDQVRQQAALEGAARQNLSRVQLDVVNDVKTLYYNLVQNRRLTTVAESNVANRQSQLQLAQANLDAGIGAPADVVRAKTNLADAVQSLVTARNTEDSSQVLLAESIGVNPLTPIATTDEDEAAIPRTEPLAMIAVALARRPEILQAQQNIRAADLGINVARRTNSPSIGLGLGLNARGQNDPLETQTATLTLSLNWPFADGGLTRGRTEEARANRQSAEATLRQASLAVSSEVGRATLALGNAEQRLDLARVQLANAQEGVRLAEGRYRGGVGTFLEITDSQSALFTAERAVEQARGDISRARAALRRAIGEPIS